MSSKSVSIINGNIIRRNDTTGGGIQQEQIMVDQSGKGMLPPIGTIVAVLPTTSTITELTSTKSANWVECTGQIGYVFTLEDESTLNINIPNLQNDVFLMGASGVASTGGTNDGHRHTQNNLSATMDSNIPSGGLLTHTHDYSDSDDGLTDSGDNHIGTVRNNLQCGSSTDGANSSGGGTNMNHTHVLNLSGTIGNVSGFDGSSTGANMPLYFKCVFYIRYR